MRKDERLRTDPELTQDESEGPGVCEGVDGTDGHDDQSHNEIRHRQTHNKHVAHLQNNQPKSSLNTEGQLIKCNVCTIFQCIQFTISWFVRCLVVLLL